MKWVARMEPKSSGGVTGCCLARMYMVFLMESVATTTLLSAFVYLHDISLFRLMVVSAWKTNDSSISPSKSTQTVISNTVCTPVSGFRWTL